MRITRLEAENFKRIKAVDITPDENTVVIAGRNAQGKTSVLDAIMAALAGRNGAKELVRPIRDGESKARVAVELDDLVIERRWTASGSTVTVSPKGGNAKLNSPQKVLDQLIGSLSFDPLAFAEADPKSQVATLIDLIGREAFDALAAERKSAYENRTEINRAIKGHERTLQHYIDQLPAQRPEVLEEVEVSRLSIELEAAIEVERARAQYMEIEQEIEHLRAKQSELSKAALAVVENVNPRPSDEIRGIIKSADENNRIVRQFKQVDELTEALERDREVAARHTELIESVDAQKARLIAEARLPVDGLAFSDDGVTYNGVPFVQSSAAERLKVSVGMAMALNPELRVICIRDASLLDDDSKRALIALAEEHDFQIWYEVVGDGGEIGVVIEDGQVQA